MEAPKACQSCHKLLAADVPLGLCPECLIKSGFDTGAEADTAANGGPGFVPPPVDAIVKLFPQFEVLELLGKGGMGAVYKARQPRLNRFVALKILATGKEADPQFFDRFAREAQTLARLNHPNIVAVYDFGESGGHCYLVMEFVDGMNLRQLMRSQKIASDQALAIVPHICEALQYAHEQGVVHRDVKPENILLDKQGRVKIADFGIAKILGQTPGDASLTRAREIVGTPHYMAPEQVEKPQTVDHRADIYSLGVVFYELLTSELPLGRFAPPSQKSQIDVRLDEVVLRALEKEPELRYQQVGHVKTAMETISAQAPTPRGGTKEPRRLASWVGGLAFLAVLAVFLIIHNSPRRVAKSAGEMKNPSAGLVGWWRAEGNANDSSGTNNGIAFHDVTFAPGIDGRAFRFDGRGGHIRVPDAPNLRLATAVTVEAWVLPDGANGNSQSIIGKWDIVPNYYQTSFGMALLPSGRLGFGISNNGKPSGVSPVESTDIAPANEWLHVAGTYDGHTLKLYINGVLNNSVASEGGLFPGTGDLGIGAYVGGAPFGGWVSPFVGLIDEASLYNRALLPSEIQAIYKAGQPKAEARRRTSTPAVEASAEKLATAPAGLVGWWRADGNANDSAGTNDGKVLNEVVFVPGIHGQAFRLDGQSAHVRIPDAPNLHFTNAMTAEAWVFSEGLNDNPQTIIGKWDAVVGPDQMCYGLGTLARGALSFGFTTDGKGSGLVRVTGTHTVPTNEWIHVVGTYDGNALRLYVNGVLDNSTEFRGHIFPGTDDLGIGFVVGGAALGRGIAPFVGLIDEARLYDRALLPSEIQAHYLDGKSQATTLAPPPGEAGPLATIRVAGGGTESLATASSGRVGWWRAEGNANDSAGKNNGLVLNGATFAPGRVGQAFSLNGQGAHIRIGDTRDLHFTDAMSLAAWIYPTNVGGAGHSILDKWDMQPGLGQRSFRLCISTDGRARLSVSPSGTPVGVVELPSFGHIPTNQWTYLVATYDSMHLKLYVDGVLSGSMAFDAEIYPGTNDLAIGGQVGGNPPGEVATPFAGLIDEVSIYNRVLSPAEIAAAYVDAPLGTNAPTLGKQSP